jgi:glycosyltransferase involved in cell wall biosynthesis
MTHVLHVIPGLDAATGGTVTALTSMAVFQARFGLKVTVAATWTGEKPPGDAEQRLREAGAEVRFIGPARGPLLWHPDLARTLDSIIADADVVHAHGVWEEIQHRAAALARKRHVPYVVSPHGMLDPFNLKQKRLKKRLYLLLRLRRTLRHAAAIHFTDEVERDLAAPVTSGPPAIVEPIGIDLTEFADVPPRGTFRSRYPAIGERPVVLFLGRLHPKKAPDLLVEAFAQAQTSGAILVLAGPDSDGYRAELESLVRQRGLTERTVFTGMLRGAERVAALAEADVFALFSHQENFGVAVVEALACGTPVLISDQVNIHRKITTADVGAVARVDLSEMAALLTKWLNDPALRRAASERARPFVAANYDAQRIAARWAEHYAALAGPGVAAVPSASVPRSS